MKICGKAASEQKTNPRQDAAPGESCPSNEDEDSSELQGKVVEAEVDKLRRAVQHIRSKYQNEKQRSEEYYDRLQRLQAEFDNFRKRTLRSQKKSEKRAKIEAVGVILSPLDDLRRVLTATDDEDDPIRKGVEMILRQFEGRLADMGIRRIRTCGEKFDPNWHEAVAQVEAPGHPKGTVVDELLPGYRMDDMLVRAAKVTVARSCRSDNSESQETDCTTQAAKEDR